MAPKRTASWSAPLPLDTKRPCVLMTQWPEFQRRLRAISAVRAARLPMGIRASHRTWLLIGAAQDLSLDLAPLLEVVAADAAYQGDRARAAAAADLGSALRQLRDAADEMKQAQLRLDADDVAEVAVRLMALAGCLASTAADLVAHPDSDDIDGNEEEEEQADGGVDEKAWHDPASWAAADLRQLPACLEALLRAIERRVCRHFVGGQAAKGGRTTADELLGSTCRLAMARGTSSLLACAAVTLLLSPCYHARELSLSQRTFAVLHAVLPRALAALQEVAAGRPGGDEHLARLCCLPGSSCDEGSAESSCSCWSAPMGVGSEEDGERSTASSGPPRQAGEPAAVPVDLALPAVPLSAAGPAHPPKLRFRAEYQAAQVA